MKNKNLATYFKIKQNKNMSRATLIAETNFIHSFARDIAEKEFDEYDKEMQDFLNKLPSNELKLMASIVCEDIEKSTIARDELKLQVYGTKNIFKRIFRKNETQSIIDNIAELDNHINSLKNDVDKFEEQILENANKEKNTNKKLSSKNNDEKKLENSFDMIA